MKKLLYLFIALSISMNCFSEVKKIQETDSIESSFVIPEAFNSALDSLIFTYYAQRKKTKECNNEFNFNVHFPDSIYKKRLASLPYEIDMPYNSRIQSFIDFYTERKRPQVEKMLGLGKYYFPIFEDILNKYGIPMEFKYLPVIESAMNTGAVSRVGAAGLWQFMPSTGKMYGLKVNTLVDERRDPVKATDAAARFLKDLYQIYGDWHLAIAAYNCGPGNVNKAIRRSGGKRSFWAIYPYLPSETRSYVPIFIAANYVMNFYAAHNLCPDSMTLPVYTDTIKVHQRLKFSKVAKVLEMPIEELRILNPQYRRDIIPGNAGTYTLRLPTHYAAKFVELEDSICSTYMSKEDSLEMVAEMKLIKQAPARRGHKRSSHKVRSGENLSTIASRYGVRVSDLKRWNGLRSSRIRAGQRLIIKR